MIRYHKMSEPEKVQISGWRYEGEYAVYDLPPYEEQQKSGFGFANPCNRFFSFFDGTELIGYINLIEEDSLVRFGIGISPAFCGSGYGPKLCRSACRLSHRLFPGEKVCLVVRTWNIRAIRCYKKSGFRIVGEPVLKRTPSGDGFFYRMEETGEKA